MPGPASVDVVSTSGEESASSIRIAVSIRRNDDAPTEEIELLADELVEFEPAEPAPFFARIRSRIPPLPPLFGRRTRRPPPLAAGPSSVGTDTSEMVQLRLDVDRLLSRQRDSDAYLCELEKTYQQRSQELLEADRREAALTSRVHQQALRMAELEQQLQEKNLLVVQLQAAGSPALPPPAARVPAAAVSKDELLRIRGIGPSYAQALRALGVGSLAAVAAWSEADVSMIAERLNIKIRRIRRDRWVEQARTLLAEGESRR